MRLSLIFSVLFILFTQTVLAIEPLTIRRVTVFPISAKNASNNMLEEAWWKSREILTQNQRFLVASRRYMINRDVFQARQALKPADAIILGKILDSHALVTTFVKDGKISMQAYEGENGYLLWQKELTLHPAISINDQLVVATQNLMQDFLAAIPYQGLHIVDPIIGKAVYEEDGINLARVFIGSGSFIQANDPVEWIEMNSKPGQALLGDGLQITVIASGLVVSVDGDQAVVQIERASDMKKLADGKPVRFPKESQRLEQALASELKNLKSNPQIFSPQLSEANKLRKDKSTTSTSLAFLSSLAAFILLAF